jgi:hypothetical protein
LHKKFSGGSFITNGNDCWFNNNFDIKTCAIYCILDYFSGKLDTQKVTFETSTVDIKNTDDIYDILNLNESCNEPPKFSSSLFDPGNISDIFNYDIRAYVPEYECYSVFDDAHLPNIIVKKCNEDIDKKKQKYSVIIMGNNIEINIDDIIITDNKILFDNTGFHNRVNFASDWGPKINLKDYIVDFVDANVNGFHLPYISYVKHDKCYHFSIDMFHNDFIYKSCKKKVIDSVPHHPNLKPIEQLYFYAYQIPKSFNQPDTSKTDYDEYDEECIQEAVESCPSEAIMTD